MIGIINLEEPQILTPAEIAQGHIDDAKAEHGYYMAALNNAGKFPNQPDKILHFMEFALEALKRSEAHYEAAYAIYDTL
jgi:hypothetical protein